MNIDELRNKVEDVVNTLTVAHAEAKDIELSRIALARSEQVNTEREKRLNDLQVTIAQKEKDLASQKQYIDEQTVKNQRILTGLNKEKELLAISKVDRDVFEDDNARLRAGEKILEDKTFEFERQKALFEKQEEATNELMEVLNAREKRIKAKEESLNRREQLSQI